MVAGAGCTMRNDENPASHRYGTFVWFAVALLNAFRLSNAVN